MVHHELLKAVGFPFLSIQISPRTSMDKLFFLLWGYMDNKREKWTKGAHSDIVFF